MEYTLSSLLFLFSPPPFLFYFYLHLFFNMLIKILPLIESFLQYLAT